MVATGEVGPKPLIYIWDPKTLDVISEYKGAILKGVAALAFNPSGKKLVAAAIDDDHFIAVLNVGKPEASVKLKTGKEIIIALAFGSENSFISVGVKTYRCWSFNNNQISSTKQTPTQLKFLCAEPNGENKYVVGTSEGLLQENETVKVNKSTSQKQSEGESSEDTKQSALSNNSIDALFVTKDRLVINFQNFYFRETFLNKQLNK